MKGSARAIGLGRRLKNRLAVLAAWCFTALALWPLAHMFLLVTVQGARAFSLGLFTQVTQGRAGGLANAIAGSLLLVGLAIVAVVPLGVLGGVYMAERRDRLARGVRLATNVLAGVPSIVVGYFGYVALVTWLGWGFGALAGSLALAIIMLPFVLRATDLAVSQVPEVLREASLALGATQATTVRSVVLRAALPGILTGVLLAVGVAVGETAPLIYTAAWSNFLPALRLTHSPVGYLTYVVWAFINEPFASANALAYAAALILMLLVLLLNVTARSLLSSRRFSGR